ncbi:hypothetical protein [Aureivirga marina]|uniref:hypothetical protein n=1 Tax=Aureivirga marina TaxID=1182451 RepID=UPI0018C9E79D|nr:hypothetical protein [Aureivirga marina]
MRNLKNTITLETAIRWVKNWRKGTIINPTFIKSISMERINFDQVLAEPNVTRVKSYLGVNDQNQMVLLIVGTDDFDNDLFANDPSNHHIYDFSKVCPPRCAPKFSPLD